MADQSHRGGGVESTSPPDNIRVNNDIVFVTIRFETLMVIELFMNLQKNLKQSSSKNIQEKYFRTVFCDLFCGSYVFISDQDFVELKIAFFHSLEFPNGRSTVCFIPKYPS